MTLGDYSENIRAGILAANELLIAGYAPYCPHVTHFQQLIAPVNYEDWMQLDFEWLAVCDVLLRLPGTSRGAAREVRMAHAMEKPVYYNMKIFLEKTEPLTKVEGENELRITQAKEEFRT
jgi:hypothetical protein